MTHVLYFSMLAAARRRRCANHAPARSYARPGRVLKISEVTNDAAIFAQVVRFTEYSLRIGTSRRRVYEDFR
jgi:hypothetical protein